MLWINVTCNNSIEIVKAQRHLFNKYAPDFDLKYLNVKDEPVETWCRNVYNRLQGVRDEFIVFGLDDYLPIHHIDKKRFDKALTVMQTTDLDRFELGKTASYYYKTEPALALLYQDDIDGYKIKYDRFTDDATYQASCQFSIWRTESLKRILLECSGSPWEFEKNMSAKAGCFKTKVIFWYIEESAISGRQKGKINVLGLKPSDTNELCRLGYIDKSKLIYGWSGETTYHPEVCGDKYLQFYE